MTSLFIERASRKLVFSRAATFREAGILGIWLFAAVPLSEKGWPLAISGLPSKYAQKKQFGGSIPEMSSRSLDEIHRPWDFYNQRAKELRLELEEVVKRQGSYRTGVIVLGLFACVMLHQSVVAKRLPLWTSLFVVPPGLYLVRQSRRCQQRALKLFRLVDYYDKGIARLAYEWESLDEGRDFIDQDHFYATDLDLFGRGSLFQVLCSARTQAGRETLANWMKKSASREEILTRHAAISEL